MPKGSKEERERREGAILEIINRGEVDSQQDIVEELKRREIFTTQATVSRFLKDHNLQKNDQGCYVLTEDLERERRKSNLLSELQQYADGGLESVRIMAIHSKKNQAVALASTIQECGGDGVFGTMVDGDKVLIVFDANDQGKESINVIRNYLEQAESAAT